MLASQPPPVPVGNPADAQYVIANLPDGNHQFCSQPEPNDWRIGSGVCFWFRKESNRVIGYYGYPHTDQAVACISGDVNENFVTGGALDVSWPGYYWTRIPQSPVKWDDEGRLTLSQGSIIHSSEDRLGRTDWIHFRSASLDLNGFYRYSDDKVSQMNPPPKSCSIEAIIET